MGGLAGEFSLDLPFDGEIIHEGSASEGYDYTPTEA